jgi:hypothetical protein
LKKLYFAFAAIASVFLLWLYYNYNPAKYSFFLKCPFHYLTGFDCPGCGSQRAVFCLLHGDVMGAVHQNLLLVASLPLLTIQLGYKAKSLITKKDHKWPLLYARATPVVLAVITVAYFIVRNLPFYPFKH